MATEKIIAKILEKLIPLILVDAYMLRTKHFKYFMYMNTLSSNRPLKYVGQDHAANKQNK